MTRDQILNFLKQHRQEMTERFGVTKIGLFGSYARGDAREDSDIDVVIELAVYTADGYFGLLHFLEDNFEKRIDLGIESNIKPLIKSYIQKEIIYV
ncbi:nucleotidyltransferase family protein [Pelotalea chapellei]|uniref:Nucleotidyltransferase family protein n=1 Tax=Pelotalea chapellei TaxID=44671 RepID=A0ABS5U7X1_9BACT|nr:nucleotidyltransferase family protein [Pelotalea chapellei]MBT1071758.1 nucleotidyltransferase family protein [Pelotalea chapellei]